MNRSSYIFKVMLVAIFCGFSDLQAMTFVEDIFNTPISQLNVIRSLNSHVERDNFRSTWNKNRTLEENKKAVVHAFLEYCCDISFKFYNSEIPGIYVGKVDHGEDLIFSEIRLGIRTCPYSNDVLLYNEKNDVSGLRVNAYTNVFPDIRPLNMTQWMKKNLKQYLWKIVDDSVGCELLRIISAKYQSNKSLPKLIFIPVRNLEIGLAYTTGSTMWKYIENEDMFVGKYRKIFNRPNKFILFSPSWFDLPQRGLFVYRNGNLDEGYKAYSVREGSIPKEIGLLHQIIYALNVARSDEYNESRVIEGRSKNKYFYNNCCGRGNSLISFRKLNKMVFIDDAVYSTMFGITENGINLINEAVYTAHKYHCLRLAYVGGSKRFKFNGIDVSKVNTLKLLSRYFEEEGDHNLYEYYLSKDSILRYPEFGQGEYQYAEK